jgi:hypothetical protein
MIVDREDSDGLGVPQRAHDRSIRHQ